MASCGKGRGPDWPTNFYKKGCRVDTLTEWDVDKDVQCSPGQRKCIFITTCRYLWVLMQPSIHYVFFKFFSICSVEATTIAPFDPFCSLLLFTALFVVNLNALR